MLKGKFAGVKVIQCVVNIYLQIQPHNRKSYTVQMVRGNSYVQSSFFFDDDS